MRRALIIASLLALLLAAAGCGSANDEPGAFAQQQVEAGSITVSITPTRLDDGGASFDVVLDTHSAELDMDLTTAVLEVDGNTWGQPRWSGDGPGGHHRSGRLDFSAAGPARGTARLTLSGFPAPVETEWDLRGG